MIFRYVPTKIAAIILLKGPVSIRILKRTVYQTFIELIRIERMWMDEVKRNGIEDASLKRVVWRFTRTRVLINIILYLISLAFGFIGPVFN